MSSLVTISLYLRITMIKKTRTSYSKMFERLISEKLVIARKGTDEKANNKIQVHKNVNKSSKK